MTTAWALVPAKAFSRAKRRLQPVLGAAECATLAERMLRDVLTALRGAESIARVALYAPESLAPVAAECQAVHLVDTGRAGLNAGLTLAAAELARLGADLLLVVPGDLPSLDPAGIDALIARHHGDVTICAAAADGGTNALVLDTPPAFPFAFGIDSAAAHARAARAAGLRCATLSLDAFARDIDRPDDLDWFCAHASRGAAAEYLRDTGVAGRLATPARVVTA